MDLLEMLKVIRETCKEQKDCTSCPLRQFNNVNCEVASDKAPHEWTFFNDDNDNDKPKRLFR